MDADALFRAVVLFGFVVAGVEVGLAFLMRAERESIPDD